MAKRAAAGVLDVVVPLGGAQAEVSSLIAQLRGSTREYRLLLVDDTMTELRQGALRKRLAASAGVDCVWLRASGRGIMAALAVAAAHGRGDIVLVDPRVRLADGWFDRLCRCAASDPRIGVVATWTTADSDAPGFLQRLGVGGMWHAPDVVEEALEAAAVPVYPDAGIAVGPCVYLRRAVLGAGAGSLAGIAAAAHAAGYRAALCDDVIAQRVPYAFDTGEVAPDDAAVGKALLALGERDPVAPLRTVLRSTIGMLERRDQPGVLHVAHPRGGGTERYIRTSMAATAHSHRHYVLRIHADRFTLEDARDDGFATYDWPRDAQATPAFLRDLCTWLRIDLLHVHSLVGGGEDLLRALREAEVDYLYTAHDMYVPCPGVYLIGSDGKYCNATTDPATCRACLAGMPGLADVDIVAWRERHASFMDGARRVIGPSTWAAHTVRTYFPHANVVALPHALPSLGEPTDEPLDAYELPADERRHIGFLGAIGPEKGARRIEAMAQRIRERGLPLRLVVVGFMDREVRFRASDDVLVIHGPYEGRDLGRLLDHYRVDLVAFPAVWPETFSYTLGEAWAAGRPALVPARGALGERVDATGAGWTLDPEASIDAWLDAMLAHAGEPGALERAERARRAAADRAAVDDPVVALYAELAVRDPSRVRPPYSHHGILAAACRAAGVQALPAAVARTENMAAPSTASGSSFMRWLRAWRG